MQDEYSSSPVKNGTPSNNISPLKKATLGTNVFEKLYQNAMSKKNLQNENDMPGMVPQTTKNSK
jgi:hypothetical protein